jgi:Flp pilus assembly protein CpaB
MSSRFGGVSPTKRYAAKVRWLVACLICVILILGIAIVMVAQNSATANNNLPTGPVPAVSQPSTQTGTTDLLVAVTRIEEGTEFRQHMFGKRSWPSDSLPDKYISADRSGSLQGGKFAKRLISANMPILEDDVGDQPPLSALPIPAGFRAVTIEVDIRGSVEGYAKPNSRVDVLWTFSNNEGKKEVATIVKFTKVLSVAGTTSSEAARSDVQGGRRTTVTLLVTEKDAKKIELARNMGELSLILVGGEETSVKMDDPDTMDINDLLGRKKEETPQENPADGVMYATDPATGKQVRWVLRKGKWAPDKNF